MSRAPHGLERHADGISRSLSTLWIAALLAGCASAHPMMPTPAVYTGPEARPLFTDVPADRRTPPLDLLFLTDRAPAGGDDEELPYTADRSRSLAFGSTTIEFGDDVDWDTLAQASSTAKRSVSVGLELGETVELGRFPSIPYRMMRSDEGIARDTAVVDGHEEARQKLHAEVARRLAEVPRKELVLYVHGYHNSFEDAALTMGQLCHFLGREFACGIFTWPAGGSRGILFGYNVDYESSVFAAEHLRKTIRTLSETPGLEKLHLLAHSRGTDVLATALSELSVEAYLLGSSLPGRFKIGNIVLAAPDIDADIAPSRIFKILSDPDLPFAGTPRPRLVVQPPPGFKLTLYVSPDDKALATSSWLFGSMARLGRVEVTMLSPERVAQMRELGLLDIVQVLGTTDAFGHGYFISNPRASADLITLLRYGLAPGEPGRPLDEIERPFWRVKPVK